MKKHFIPVALIAALMAVTVLPSCKKKEDDPTRAQMLVGTWKLSQQGDDTNGDGVWQDSERQAVPADEMATTEFKSDGTGTLTVALFPVPIPFTWSLQNNDTELKGTTTFMGQSETTVETIVSMSSTDLVTKTSDSSGTFFTALKKQ